MNDLNGNAQLLELFRTSQVRCREIIHNTRMWNGWGNWSAQPYPSVVWLRQGEVLTHIESMDRPPLIREKDSVVYYPANQKKISRFQASRAAEFVAVTLTCETRIGIDFFRFLEIPTLLRPDTGAEISSLLTSLLSLPQFPEKSSDIFAIIQTRSIGLSLLNLLLREAHVKESWDTPFEMNRIRPVMEYLSNHYRERVTIQHLSSLAHLSRPQFHRQFKAFVGISPFEYTKNLRMREAAFLLLHTDQTIAQIAQSVGWDDPFHLSRLFKDFYGVSPRVYRQDRSVRTDLFI